MDSETVSIYIKNIEILTDATRSGLIKWKKQNPTTFFYESKTETKEFITSIQNVSFSGKYVFQIVEADTKEVVLDLTEEAEKRLAYVVVLGIPDYNQSKEKRPNYKLKELYYTVDKAINSASLKVFDDIIKSITK